MAAEKPYNTVSVRTETRLIKHDSEHLNALLLTYFMGIIDGHALFHFLKEAEKEGKQNLIKNARSKLAGSFVEPPLPFVFRLNEQGSISIEMVQKEVAVEKEKGNVIELSGQNFDETLNSHAALVVDCWAPWCGPCRMLSPIIEDLAGENTGKITFAKLNTDENQDIAARYQIRSIPTLLIFKDGKLVDRKVGAMPKQMLQSELDKSLA